MRKSKKAKLKLNESLYMFLRSSRFAKKCLSVAKTFELFDLCQLISKELRTKKETS